MTTQDAVVAPAAGVQSRRKALAGGVIGNLVEWYDFGVYGYMAPIMATLFFAPGDRTAALLGAFALFAVSFFTRPLGGFVFGHFGDKVGRRNTLAVCVILMSLATFAVGLLPTYAAVGVAAPALLLICRLVQGFSAGGEYMGAASFVVEYAPENRRGLYAGFLAVSLLGGLLCALGTVTLFTTFLGETAMAAWGWRVPFLLALPLGLVGLYLRLRLEDTPAFREVEEHNAVSGAPIREALRTQWRPMAIFFGFALVFVVGLYVVLTYMPAYLGEASGIDRGTALLSSAIALLVLTALCPLSGVLADLVGRKPMLLAGCGCFLVLAVPAFLVIGQGGLLWATLGQLLFAVPVFFFVSALPVSLVEMFPTRVRYSSASITYNLAQMIFGGTAPFVATFLVVRSGNVLAPAYYVSGLALVSALVVAFAFKETRRTRLVRGTDVEAAGVARD